jgi:hypothetical protein
MPPQLEHWGVKLVGVAFSGLLIAASPCCAAEILLRWTSTPSATGYRIYVGTHSRQYDIQRDAGSLEGDVINGIAEFVEGGLDTGRRYFVAVTAYNDFGESDFSNEREVAIDAQAIPHVEAGPDRDGRVAQVILLGGSPDPGLRYLWLQVSGPAMTLTTAHAAQTSVVLSAPGVSEFVLVASDASGVAASDVVRVVAAESVLGSPTPTPPRTSPTAMRTPSPTPSPSPTATSDFCNATAAPAAITIDDIVRGVGIAIGTSPLDSCPRFDMDGDQRVTVDEVIFFVNQLLEQGAVGNGNAN